MRAALFGLAVRSARLVAAASALAFNACEVRIQTPSNLPDFEIAELLKLRSDTIAYAAKVQLADLDSDGQLDLLIGNPAIEDGWRGSVLAFSLRDLSVIALVYPCTSPDDPLPGYESFGSSLVVADFNGDGPMDLAIGNPRAPGAKGPACGEVWVYFAPIDPCQFTRIPSPSAVSGGEFGRELAACDFDGDGFSDLVVAQPAPGNAAESSVLVFSGRNLELLALLEGDAEQLEFGASLEVIPPTGPRPALLAVGAPAGAGASSKAAVYLYSCGDGLEVTRLESGSSDPTRFGRGLSCGDFNGDAVAELAFSEWLRAPGVDVFDSTDWSRLHRFAIRSSAGTGDFPPGLRSLLDVTGDGRDELMILSASGADRALIYLSPLKSGAYVRLDQPATDAVSGDIDGDGNPEILVSTCELWMGLGTTSTIRVLELH